MVEEGIDALYALDPGEFVAARNELAKRLRRAGDREAAAEVAKLRRPSPAAWAVNQLVRRDRPDVEELVRLGEVLRDAQDRALAGDPPGDLRAAGRARRDAVARLTEKAERILAERGAGPGVHAADVGATLEAASLDGEAAAAVLGGRLSSELRPPSGFGVLDGVVAGPRERPAPEPRVEPGTDRRELEEAEAAAAEARQRWEERSAEARAAVERVAERRRQVQAAEAEVARLATLLEEAQRAVRRSVREAERAEDAAARAEDVAARAAERLRRADQRLAELGG